MSLRRSPANNDPIALQSECSCPSCEGHLRYNAKTFFFCDANVAASLSDFQGFTPCGCFLDDKICFASDIVLGLEADEASAGKTSGDLSGDNFGGAGVAC